MLYSRKNKERNLRICCVPVGAGVGVCGCVDVICECASACVEVVSGV